MSADVFPLDAIHRTHGQAEFAASAEIFDDGMHAFMGANDGIHRASLDAQGAADAPVFVNVSQVPGAFKAMRWVQALSRLSCQQRQLPHPLFTAWWALVDGGLLCGNGLRISSAILEAATLALCLRQHRQDAID